MNKKSQLKIVVVVIVVFIMLFAIFLFYQREGVKSKKSKDILISHDSSTSDIYKTSDGSFKKIQYMGPVNMPISENSDTYLPYTTITNFTMTDNEMILEWYDKKVVFEFYDVKNDKKEKFKDKNNSKKDDLEFKNDKKDNKGNYYFTHNMTKNKNKQPDKFGYNITTTNTDCIVQGYRLICDEQTINFNQAVKYQNLTVEMNKNWIEISAIKVGSKLEYIDPSIQYNFNATYRSNQMIATENGDDVGWATADVLGGINWGTATTLNIDSSEPLINTGTAIFGEVDSIIYGDLQTIDSSGAIHDIDDPPDNGGGWIFIANPDEDTNDITEINWTIVGLTEDLDDLWLRGFIYNNSASNWYQCISPIGSTYYVSRNCNISSFSYNISNYINSSGYIHFGIFGDWDFDLGFSRYIALDYISLEITYNDLIVNLPTTNQETLNNLSLELNTTQSGYNDTIWYSWNNGIINTTLCSQSNSCQNTITFPRQGNYDLLVWGNKSDGTEKMKNISGLFIGSGIFGTGWKDPTATGEDHNQWVNPTNAYLSNNQYASTDTNTRMQDYYNFPLNIQSGSKIYGIMVSIEAKELISGSSVIESEISWDGGTSYTSQNKQKTYTTVESTQIYGGTTDKWGRNWSSSDFSNANFRVRIEKILGIVSYVDNIRVNISFSNYSSNSPPTTNLILANNTNYTSVPINFTFNISDDNDYVNNVSLYINNVLNTTITYPELDTTINITANLSDGKYNWKVLVCDSDNECANSFIHNLTLDKTPPTTTPSATSPPDGASYTFGDWTNNNVKVTLTAYDAIAGVNVLSYPIYCVDTTNTCTPSTYISSGVTISTQGTSYIRYASNDTLGNSEVITSKTLNIDTGYPDLYIKNPLNGSNSSDTGLDIKYTTNDTVSSGSCWYSSNDGVTNTSQTCGTNITSPTWSEGSNTIILWVNDSANNVNKSEVTFTIDTIYPSLSIVSPLNLSTSSDNTLDIKYNFTELHPSNCWYSNDTYNTNTTLTNCGTNITDLVWSDDVHNVTIWINDSASNIASNFVRFTIDSAVPEIYIKTPINATNTTDNTLNINYTVFDSVGLSSCWWTNDTGITNYTQSCSLNITTAKWAEGQSTVFIYVNDSLNNLNFSEVTFQIDTTSPSINLYTPSDAEEFGFNTLISVNYTAYDTGVGVSTCWFNIDDGANTTIANCLNSTFDTSEANHNITLYVNDSLNNVNKVKNAFTVSLTAPAITLDSPLDNKILNSNTNYFNFTATDTNGISVCYLYTNISGSYQINDTFDSVTSGVQVNTIKNISDGVYFWSVWCNDTVNNGRFANTNYTFRIDGTYPLISYTVNTKVNATNTTKTFIYIETSVTEVNPINITYTLFNKNGVVNITTKSMTDQTSNVSINFTSLLDGIYDYNVSIRDIANNNNVTETRTITLDDTPPTITLLNPVAKNYGNNDSMAINLTVTDNLIGLDECWYYIRNSSGSTVKSTETLVSCRNDTFTLPGGDIDYTLYVFAKDNLTNTQSTSVTFGIRTISPVVVLSPTNDTHINNLYNHLFNFTVDTNADNITNCSLYGDFSGAFELNQSTSNPVESTTISFSEMNLSENSYQWNVQCFDNFGTGGWALNNLTFVTDITFPQINSSTITPTEGSQTFTFTSNSSDTYNMTCKYSIYDSTGSIDGLNQNVSFTCNKPVSATVTAFGTYNLTVYAKDKAGNENSTTDTFTVSTASRAPGGGGTSITIIQGVTAIEATNFTITTTNLQKQMDMILARDSVKTRQKQFLLLNDGIEEIEVEIICDTQNTNKSSHDIDVCDYVSFEQTKFTVSPNVEERVIGNFEVLTPENSSIGDEYFFNLLAIRTIGQEQRFSKLSVRARVSRLAIFIRWSELPGATGQSIVAGEVKEQKGIIYPVTPVALISSFIIAGIIFFVFRKLKLTYTGFFISMLSFLIFFSLLLWFL